MQVDEEFGVANLDVPVEVPPGMVEDTIIVSIQQYANEVQKRLVTYAKYLSMFCPSYILETRHTVFKVMDLREPWTIFEAKLIG